MHKVVNQVFSAQKGSLLGPECSRRHMLRQNSDAGSSDWQNDSYASAFLSEPTSIDGLVLGNWCTQGGRVIENITESIAYRCQ